MSGNCLRAKVLLISNNFFAKPGPRRFCPLVYVPGTHHKIFGAYRNQEKVYCARWKLGSRQPPGWHNGKASPRY